MSSFHIADGDAIREGRVTDVYFARTREILEARGIDVHVRAEFIAKSFPDGKEWGVLAGLDEAMALLEGRPLDVRAMPEGTVYRAWEPILEIRGEYRDFAVLETALLGFLCQASGIATRAARAKRAAGERNVVSFGARRMHPAIAPMIERAAYLGGCDGVATVAAAEELGISPTGTMPHALMLVAGDTVKAVEWFDEAVDPDVPRVALIDTFNDEKFEAIRVAERFGDRLEAVRLDTPGTRKGDFYEIFRETRWELDLRGFEEVRLFASGGLGADEIERLNPVVDGYGIGTWISAAPVIDLAMDIVEVDGAPRAKRGKHSGGKDPYRCPGCGESVVVPAEDDPGACPRCGGELDLLLRPVLESGEAVAAPGGTDAIRRRVSEGVELAARRTEGAA